MLNITFVALVNLVLGSHLFNAFLAGLSHDTKIANWADDNLPYSFIDK